MMENFKKQKLIVSFEEVRDELLNTPEKRVKFEKEYKKFVEQNRKEVLKEMGEDVKKARIESGVTQEELARRLKTTRSTISRVEKGDQNLTVEYIIKVARALGKQYEIRIY